MQMCRLKICQGIWLGNVRNYLARKCYPHYNPQPPIPWYNSKACTMLRTNLDSTHKRWCKNILWVHFKSLQKSEQGASSSTAPGGLGVVPLALPGGPGCQGRAAMPSAHLPHGFLEYLTAAQVCSDGAMRSTYRIPFRYVWPPDDCPPLCCFQARSSSSPSPWLPGTHSQINCQKLLGLLYHAKIVCSQTEQLDPMGVIVDCWDFIQCMSHLLQGSLRHLSSRCKNPADRFGDTFAHPHTHRGF